MPSAALSAGAVERRYDRRAVFVRGGLQGEGAYARLALLEGCTFLQNQGRSEANRHDALTPVTSVRPSRQRLHVRAATAVDNIQY